jgi:hypothetical protein
VEKNEKCTMPDIITFGVGMGPIVSEAKLGKAIAKLSECHCFEM